ncbi:hypothetical protein N9090_00420 [bacterium]|nr:hypothetical protein [bacterium]
MFGRVFSASPAEAMLNETSRETSKAFNFFMESCLFHERPLGMKRAHGALSAALRHGWDLVNESFQLFVSGLFLFLVQ